MGRVAAFMACIPFVTPFTVVGIPFGIWAMSLLKQPDVLAAFESAACLRRRRNQAMQQNRDNVLRCG